MKSFRLYTFAALLAVLFAACESNNLFLSENGVRKKLQGNWEMMKIAKDDVKQIWDFNDGVLTTTVYDKQNNVAATYVGTYVIQTTTAAAYMDIPDAGFENAGGSGVVAGRWLIDDISTSQLNMQHTEVGTNAIYYREFIKR